ncbi:hypothetical protein [Gimesia sp.]|uniref:hypothetical protein n=1 Tax=Gimesia sp. TaxID=2024833 RepID=UPI000C5CE12E|nr:hypothetical protein [Gimesia sp.]MAX35635.1 hypothetical protein [Gimesia sp.]HAH43863.1 hypothetical protein [Planctomycetaceae bacterium]HBL46609.1 hypothetical protein [Planctomycetaceae bacterium]
MRRRFNNLVCLCFAVTILVQTIIPCAACCCQHHECKSHPETAHSCQQHRHIDPALESAQQSPDSQCPFCVCSVKQNLVLTPSQIHQLQTFQLQNLNLFCSSSLQIIGDQTNEITVHRIWLPNEANSKQCSIVTFLGRQLI